MVERKLKEEEEGRESKERYKNYPSHCTNEWLRWTFLAMDWWRSGELSLAIISRLSVSLFVLHSGPGTPSDRSFYGMEQNEIERTLLYLSFRSSWAVMDFPNVQIHLGYFVLFSVPHHFSSFHNPAALQPILRRRDVASQYNSSQSHRSRSASVEVSGVRHRRRRQVVSDLLNTRQCQRHRHPPTTSLVRVLSVWVLGRHGDSKL